MVGDQHIFILIDSEHVDFVSVLQFLWILVYFIGLKFPCLSAD